MTATIPTLTEEQSVDRTSTVQVPDYFLGFAKDAIAPTPAFVSAIRDNELAARIVASPISIAVWETLKDTQKGFTLIYHIERDHQYGREVFGFFFDIARLIIWPLLALILTGIATGLRYLCSKDCRDAVGNGYLWLLGRSEAETNEQKVEQLIADEADVFPTDERLNEEVM